MKKLLTFSVILMAIAFPLTACGALIPPATEIGIMQTSTPEAHKPAPIPTVETQPSVDQSQIRAINNIRVALGLPNLTLESKGTDTMINSPSGDLPVVIYTDSEGRKYSVEPVTNTVVEIDARDLLSSIPASAPILSQVDIKAKINKMLAVAIPDFDTLSQSLSYEEGVKIDYYFFNWYGNMSAGSFNRPFIQVGVYKTGFIFAYYNTITITNK